MTPLETIPKPIKELDSDVGYLPDMVLNELKRGRKVHITGSVFEDILTMDEFTRKRKYIEGRFGITKFWANNVANIVTRPMPQWAITVFENHKMEATESKRWVKG